MRWSFVLLCLVADAPLLYCADKPEWKEFASKDGGFKVLMHTTPTPDTHEIMTDLGKVKMHFSVAEIGEWSCIVAYGDYPEAIKKQPAKVRYDIARDALLAYYKGGKLQVDKDFKFGNHSGRELQIDLPDSKQLYRTRWYLIDIRFYQVVSVGPMELVATKEVDKFFESFKVDRDQK